MDGEHAHHTFAQCVDPDCPRHPRARRTGDELAERVSATPEPFSAGDWRLPHSFMEGSDGRCNRLDAVKGGGRGRRCGLTRDEHDAAVRCAVGAPDGPLHWLRRKFLLREDELDLRQWKFVPDDRTGEELLHAISREPDRDRRAAMWAALEAVRRPHAFAPVNFGGPTSTDWCGYAPGLTDGAVGKICGLPVDAAVHARVRVVCPETGLVRQLPPAWLPPELAELAEPEWHRGCTWCWRTIWHGDG